MRVSEGMADPFPLTPYNIVLTHVPRWKRVELFADKRLKHMKFHSRSVPCFTTTDLLQALHSLILVLLEIWIDLHIFSRKQNPEWVLLIIFCRPSVGYYNKNISQFLLSLSQILWVSFLVIIRMTLVFDMFIESWRHSPIIQHKNIRIK